MNWLKRKATCGCLIWVVFSAAPAKANGDVLLLEDPVQAQPGLAAALRIQLSGVAALQVRKEPAGGSVAARIQAATALAHQSSALLVVWADRPVQLTDGSQEAVLYAVGQRQGRALLEVVRVPGGQGPDMDRTLALKIREIASELERAQAEAPEPLLLAPERIEHGDEPIPTIKGDRAWPIWSSVLAIDALGGPDARATLGQWGAGGAVGASLRTRELRVSGLLGLDWFPAVTVRNAGSRVVLEEITPALALRAQWKAGPLWIGGRAGFALSFLSATGFTQGGARGDYSTRLPTLNAGPELELALGSGFGVGFGLELAVRMRHQRLLVNDAEVADLNPLRAVARLSLFWHSGTGS